MNLANYSTALNSAGKLGQYPLSTETLSFIQEQILLVQQFSAIVDGGRSSQPIVIKSPTRIEGGVALYKGELLPISPIGIDIKAGKYYDLCLSEQMQDISIQGDSYKAARTLRSVYIALQGSAGSIGLVRALSQSAVYTPGFSSLQELAHRAASLVVQASLPAPLVGEEPVYFGKMLIQEAQLTNLNEDDLALPKSQLVGAVLTTSQLTDGQGAEIGFMQELETSQAIRLRRVVATDQSKGVLSQGWHCLPHQVVGVLATTSSASLDSIVQGTAQVERSGVFENVRLQTSYDGFQGAIQHKYCKRLLFQFNVGVDGINTYITGVRTRQFSNNGESSFFITLPGARRDSPFTFSVVAIAY